MPSASAAAMARRERLRLLAAGARRRQRRQRELFDLADRDDAASSLMLRSCPHASVIVDHSCARAFAARSFGRRHVGAVDVVAIKRDHRSGSMRIRRMRPCCNTGIARSTLRQSGSEVRPYPPDRRASARPEARRRADRRTRLHQVESQWSLQDARGTRDKGNDQQRPRNRSRCEKAEARQPLARSHSVVPSRIGQIGARRLPAAGFAQSHRRGDHFRARSPVQHVQQRRQRIDAVRQASAPPSRPLPRDPMAARHRARPSSSRLRSR